MPDLRDLLPDLPAAPGWEDVADDLLQRRAAPAVADDGRAGMLMASATLAGRVLGEA